MAENDSRRISILPPEEARRIAAGEVIDRPAALVREFLDNAIDAGALNIEVSIEEGGCKKIQVTDDGAGMSREDIELCSLPHATSKIRSLNDLDTAVTLGFRGEALAAAAAAARLEIISGVDGKQAVKLETGPGESYPPVLEQTRRTRGTTVRAINIFQNIPARKRFLKREGSEAMLCRQAFIDKALAFPAVGFRFIQDGKQKDFLPSVRLKKERFAAALLRTDENLLIHEINVTGESFGAAIVIGSPELYRNDRRQLYVFANGRRVQDYSLVQAVEYGAQGWFPNGTHPVAAVYVEIDPALADFNIHPAKKEVRFRDPQAVHHAVSGGLRNFFHSYYIEVSHKDAKEPELQITEREEKDYREYHSPQRADSTWFDRISSGKKTQVNETPAANGQARYAGRAFGLFILIEQREKLFLIDQHAAHERILYNHFLKQPIPKQELLAPIPFRTESAEEDNFLESRKEELERLGITVTRDGNTWQIETLPADWHTGDEETVKAILELQTTPDNIAERWAASLSCKAAIKDGDFPDDETAFNLGMEALSLPEPRCPHGRPIWTEISRDALMTAVRRTERKI